MASVMAHSQQVLRTTPVAEAAEEEAEAEAEVVVVAWAAAWAVTAVPLVTQKAQPSAP
jgi:hypothetical protein